MSPEEIDTLIHERIAKAVKPYIGMAMTQQAIDQLRSSVEMVLGELQRALVLPEDLPEWEIVRDSEEPTKLLIQRKYPDAPSIIEFKPFE